MTQSLNRPLEEELDFKLAEVGSKQEQEAWVKVKSLLHQVEGLLVSGSRNDAAMSHHPSNSEQGNAELLSRFLAKGRRKYIHLTGLVVEDMTTNEQNQQVEPAGGTGAADQKKITVVASGNDYELIVNVEKFEPMIFARNTIAGKLFPPNVCEVLFMVFRKFPLVLFLLMVGPLLCFILSVPGFFPDLGYFVPLGVIPTAFLILHSNAMVMWMLLRSSNFWIFTAIMLTGFGCLAEGVKESNPRLVGAVFGIMGAIGFLISDAKTPSKRKSNANAFVNLTMGLFALVILVLWYSGMFVDFQMTVVPVVGSVTFTPTSVGFTAMSTMAAICFSYAYTSFVTKQNNPLLVLKPKVAYHKKSINSNEIEEELGIEEMVVLQNLLRDDAVWKTFKLDVLQKQKAMIEAHHHHRHFETTNSRISTKIQRMSRRLVPETSSAVREPPPRDLREDPIVINESLEGGKGQRVTSDKIQVGTQFEMKLSMVGVPKEINSRQTLASRLFSERQCDGIFALYRKLSNFLHVFSLVGMISAVACMVADFQWVGYLSLLLLPAIAFSVLHFNVELCKALVQSFYFWFLVLLITVGGACLLDMVRTGPARIISACIAYVGAIWILLQDAKFPSKKRNRILSLQYIMASVQGLILIGTYYDDLWVSPIRTRFEIRNIIVDVPSICISFVGSYSVITLKYAISSYIEGKPNPLNILRPGIYYEMVVNRNEGNPHQQQVPMGLEQQGQQDDKV